MTESVAGRVIGVAIAVPAPFGPQLEAWRRRFGDPQADVIPAHVTLLPPTTIDADLLPEVEDHLGAVAETATSFAIRLHGTGTFRPVSPVVFAALAEGIAPCEQLEARVRAGVLWRPVHFPYHPHVTVAHDVPEDVLDQARDALDPFSARFTVDGFALYEHTGGVWVTRREFRFGGVGGR